MHICSDSDSLSRLSWFVEDLRDPSRRGGSGDDTAVSYYCSTIDNTEIHVSWCCGVGDPRRHLSAVEVVVDYPL